MELDFQPSFTPYLSALQAIAWFLASTIAFSVASHQSHTALRYLLFPAVVLPAYFSFTTVEDLEPVFPDFDRIWCFTVVTYTCHVLAVLYVENRALPSWTCWGVGTKVDWKAAYKAWNNPRRLRAPAEQIPAKEKRRISFAANRLSKITLLHLVDRYVIVQAVSLLHPTLQTFKPDRLHYLPDLTPLGEFLLRLYISHSWIWSAYLHLSTYNAIVSTLFVTILRLDDPDEWPPLYGNPIDAYSLRRFWGRFWHSIVSGAHVLYAEHIAGRYLELKYRSASYKAFVALYIFAAAGLTHEFVNWQTGTPGPMWGDAKFFLLNFTGTFIESLVSRTARPHVRWMPGYARRAIGYVCVVAWFYCIAGVWQFGIVYDI